MGEGAYLYIEVGQTFNVTGIDGNKDVDEDMDVSEANFLESEACYKTCARVYGLGLLRVCACMYLYVKIQAFVEEIFHFL